MFALTFHHAGQGLIRKIGLIPKIMTLQPGKQTIAIHKFSPTFQKVKAIRE